MMQEDSNGESTFEFVDQKADDASISEDTTNKDMTSLSTSTSASPLVPISVGNLLSNVPPPSALPSFVSQPAEPFVQNTQSQPSIMPSQKAAETSVNLINPAVDEIESTLVSNLEENTNTAGSGSGRLLSWVKGAVGRVAEKAKNSVDSMITTLDPQMREFLYSGGDMDIIVASDKEIKISPVREAFQTVFGKATVSGLAAQSVNVAVQPVGFKSAIKAAEQRIAFIRSENVHYLKHTIIAIENFLVEVTPGKWFDVGLVMLDDPKRDLTLQTFTQMTPIPVSIVDIAKQDTPEDYPQLSSGFAVTIGSLMARNLQVHHSEWHLAATGVSRREQLLLTSKALAGIYKNTIGCIL